MFPTFGLRNITLFYLLAIFLNAWFTTSNWVFMFAQYISVTQIGIVEGVAVLVAIMMEVPSGALADLIGKKKTIIFGSLMQILSCIILVQAREFWQFLVGNICMFIGFSFHSGTIEAFAYDALLEHKQQDKYSKVIGKHGVLSTITVVGAIFLGGWFYRIDPTLPFVAWAITLVVSVFVAMMTSEPKIDSVKFNLRNYLLHLRDGTKILFGESIRKYLIPILGLPIIIKLYQGLVRQSGAAYFGYTGETFGYLLAVVMIPAILVSYKFDELVGKYREKRLLLITIGGYLTAFVLGALSNKMFVGGLFFLLLMFFEKIAQPLVSLLINERTPSKYRATTLSTLSLVTQLPYVVLVMGFAWIVESQYIPYLYVGYGLFMFWVMWSTSKTKDETIKAQSF